MKLVKPHELLMAIFFAFMVSVIWTAFTENAISKEIERKMNENIGVTIR